MEAKRLIVKSHFERGLNGAQIFKIVKKIGIGERFVYRTISRLRDTGSIKNRPGSGRPRSVRSINRIKAIREKVRRNPRRSAGKLALESGISKTSMRRILNIDLGLKPYKKIKRHGLSAKNKKDRIDRCKRLLKRHGQKSVEKIVFSDEKMWMLQESYNAQNDRIYSISINDVPQNVRTVQRYQNSSAIMVWGAVSHNGKLPLIFVDKGTKINAEFYQREILAAHLKPEADRLYPNADWCFQQDSAPSHKAKVNQTWCKSNCPNFIASQDWPAASPDLNPLDYFVWGKLTAIVNAKQHRSLADLKRTILREWEKLPLKEVRAAIAGWRNRLQLVIDHNGDRFE